MSTRRHVIGLLVSVALFGAAVWVLQRQLAQYSVADILDEMRTLPLWSVMGAVVLTILSYALLTGYDVLAMRYIAHPVSHTHIVRTSFISTAFGMNVGFSTLTSGSVRYRLYTKHGVSPLAVTKVALFCSLTSVIGFLTAAGVIFIIQPLHVPEVLGIPDVSLWMVGIIFLSLVGIYLLWAAVFRKPIRAKSVVIEPPSLRVALGQVVFATLDWVVIASVLYALFVSYPIPFFQFMGIFMIAAGAGFVSQIPGGLGVFETVMIAFLSPQIPADTIIGKLLVYRVIYFLIPLLVATCLLGMHELRNRNNNVPSS